MKYARDGSLLVTFTSTRLGMFSETGATRMSEVVWDDETPLGQGVYDETGALRVVVDSAGNGKYDPTGAFRVSTESGNGIFSRSGGFRITIEEDL